MMAFIGLVWAVVPVAFVACISPVVFLNASTVFTQAGRAGALRFLAGNAVVVAALGVASMGLLGAAAESDAQREIASRTVDRFLGLILLCYGAYLMVRWWQKGAEPSATKSADRGEFGWGVLGMATNFTTLPLVMSIGQRLGTGSTPLLARALLLVITLGIVLAPAWLPMVLATVSPGHSQLRPQTRARVERATSLISAIACLVGSLVLIFHGV